MESRVLEYLLFLFMVFVFFLLSRASRSYLKRNVTDKSEKICVEVNAFHEAIRCMEV
jgi:hypothetical protein